MAAYVKFFPFVNDLAAGNHLLKTSGGHTLTVALTNTLPAQTNAVLSDITQIAAGNGYSSGGTATTISSAAQTSGTFKIVCTNVVFTASGGTIGPLRYAVLYNATPTSPLKPLIAYWDYGSSITLNDTETFTVSFDATNGVFTLA